MKTRDIIYRRIYVDYQNFPGIGRYRKELYDVGIKADGTLHNPRGYPEEIVRRALLEVEENRAKRRREGAKKAAATRAARREKKIYDVILNLRLGFKYGPADYCVVCGKGLGDPESIGRGIGSDCWQEIIQRIEKIEEKKATEARKETV